MRFDMRIRFIENMSPPQILRTALIGVTFTLLLHILVPFICPAVNRFGLILFQVFFNDTSYSR